MGMAEIITSSPSFTFQRLRVTDATSLARFYNRLSQESKRTFRPIGPITVPEKCTEIAVDNINEGMSAQKYDIIAIFDGEIIGWGFIWDLHTATPTFGLAIADDYHNHGVGKQLMTHVMDWARSHTLKEVHLTVVQDNEVAWKLYQQQGFVITGEFIGDDGQPYFRMVTRLQKNK
jgi:ribosomal-protein-alanine N-acetyltransferase